jgi:hypothetical protein
MGFIPSSSVYEIILNNVLISLPLTCLSPEGRVILVGRSAVAYTVKSVQHPKKN